MAIRIAKWSLVVAVVGGILFASWTVYRHNVRVSWVYGVEARFKKMPANDKALTEWLRSQPGVVPHTVAIGRFEDGGKLLYILFIQSRNLAGQPPFPDLDGEASRLGYTDSDGPFRDAAENRDITTE